MQNAPSTILSFKFSGSRPSYLAIPLIKSKRVLFFSLQYFTYSSFNYYFKYHQNVPFYRSCFQKYHENLDQPLRFVDTYSKFALIVYTTNVLQIARLILVPTLMFVLVLWCCVCIGGNWSSQWKLTCPTWIHFINNDLTSVLILIIADQILNNLLCCSDKYNWCVCTCKG